MQNPLTPQELRVLEGTLEGKKLREIAADLGVSKPRISQIKNSDRFREALQEAQAQIVASARQKFAATADTMAGIVIQIAKDGKPADKVRLGAALAALDRAGLTGAPTRLELEAVPPKEAARKVAALYGLKPADDQPAALPEVVDS